MRDLQDRLATLGLNSGRIDGIFGAQTETAVREFQRNYGLPPDGIIAAQSVRALTGLPRMASDLPIGVLREREALRRRTATGSCGTADKSCAPFVCNNAGTACLKSCDPATGAGCASGKYCGGFAATCMDKLGPGKTCFSNAACLSNQCVSFMCQ